MTECQIAPACIPADNGIEVRLMTDILLGEEPLDEQLENEDEDGQGDEAKKAGKHPPGPGPGPQLVKVLLLQYERC